MPAGILTTIPLPVPIMFTVRMGVWIVKLAVTVVAVVIVTLHVLVPEQPPPLQLVKVEPVEATAVSVTTVL